MDFNPQPKNKPYRKKSYREWVKSLPCCVCDRDGVDVHHAIAVGLGGSTGSTAGDNYAMPLCRHHHQELHRDPKKWEGKHGSQLSHIDKITELARQEGLLDPFLCFSTGLEDEFSRQHGKQEDHFERIKNK